MASEFVVKCCWCQESFVIEESGEGSILFCSPACSLEYNLYIRDNRYKISNNRDFSWEGIWDNVVRELEE